MSSSDSTQFDAWHPGIKSKIPSELLPLVTLYRPETSSVDFNSAKELSDFCGINETELVSFRIERLLIHELLVRVTADLSVPDGPNYEDLGINLRSMVKTIYDSYVTPELPSIQDAFDKKVSAARDQIEQRLQADLFLPPQRQAPAATGGFLARLFGKKQTKKASPETEEPAELRALKLWKNQYADSSYARERHCLQALRKVIDALVSQRGTVPKDPELISRITVNMASNDIGAELVATLIEPILAQAIQQENYRRIPAQSKPTIMNVKGASASGKSTIRQKQRQLAEKLSIAWEDVALISPDYWRKYLLDYDSLGEHYKYAAMLTGQELAIIDQKLDAYMASKAEQNDMSHMLIDRFRFDSFSVETGGSNDSRLLSRFGDRLFLFFMVTPPAETVVRAWARGQTTGRYKAVDDLLYHNIEAFTGMPELFLSWVKSNDKQIHFEFLDNDVPLGQVPATAAFGRNNHMVILDLNLMRNIDRYRCVNVDAISADQVLTDKAIKNDCAFAQRCIQSIAHIQFADKHSGDVYAEFSHGKLAWCDVEDVIRNHSEDELKALFGTLDAASKAAGEYSIGKDALAPRPTLDVAEEKRFTLGAWA